MDLRGPGVPGAVAGRSLSDGPFFYQPITIRVVNSLPPSVLVGEKKDNFFSNQLEENSRKVSYMIPGTQSSVLSRYYSRKGTL